jgi:GNAT superfamily N-acetyltransferase
LAPEHSRGQLTIRPYEAQDGPFLARIAQRLKPNQTTSPRDPAAMEQFFSALASGRLLSEPGSEAFVATLDGAPAGVISVHPDADYFTGHPRAYVDVLVVAQDAEGHGVGRALMDHAEQWARAHNCWEVVLDVFASNDNAIRFYERRGYQSDHVRMTKPLR